MVCSLMSVEQSEVQTLSSVEFGPLCHLSVNIMLMVSVVACFVSTFQIVIWDYYQRSKSKKLTNLNETLEEAQINMDHEVWCSLSIFLLRSPPRHCIVACFAVTFERNIAMFLSRHLFLLQSVLHAICHR